MDFSYGDKELSIKRAQIVVNPEELAKTNPNVKRMFDIISELVNDIEGLIDIGFENIKATLNQAISEEDKDMIAFALGGFAMMGVLGQKIEEQTQSELLKILPELMDKDLVNTEDEQEVNKDNTWNFGGAI